MLIGIHKALHADILHLLASMGHGDSVVIADANFPSTSIGRQTSSGQHVEAGVDAITLLDAIMPLFPIDPFDPENPAVKGMQVVGEPDTIPDFIRDAKLKLADKGADVTLIERFAFYEAAKESFAVKRTCEARPYGNLILRKGVVG